MEIGKLTVRIMLHTELRQVRSKLIQEALSEEILMGHVQLGKTVRASADEENDCLKFAVVTPEAQASSLSAVVTVTILPIA